MPRRIWRIAVFRPQKPEIAEKAEKKCLRTELERKGGKTRVVSDLSFLPPPHLVTALSFSPASRSLSLFLLPPPASHSRPEIVEIVGFWCWKLTKTDPSDHELNQVRNLDPVQETVKPSNGQIRYRSPSAAELTHSHAYLDAKMKRAQQESIPDKIQQYKGVILVVSIPLLLISFALFLMPRSPPAPELMTTEDMSMVAVAVGQKTVPGGLGPRSYAVIYLCR